MPIRPACLTGSIVWRPSLTHHDSCSLCTVQSLIEEKALLPKIEPVLQGAAHEVRSMNMFSSLKAGLLEACLREWRLASQSAPVLSPEEARSLVVSRLPALQSSVSALSGSGTRVVRPRAFFVTRQCGDDAALLWTWAGERCRIIVSTLQTALAARAPVTSLDLSGEQRVPRWRHPPQ